jgi:FixJ family two-component response regulator
MNNGKPIIAIVDDEKEICSLLVRLFKKRDIPVSFVAHNDLEALSKWGGADPKPDIVILDYRLQYANGVDMMRKMLTIQPSTKVILLSSDLGAMKEAYEAGAVLFLMKPVGIKTITDAVDIVHNNQGKYEYDGFRFSKCTV